MVLDLIQPVVLHTQMMEKMLKMFGADMTNSIHATNQTQSVLVLGHGLIQTINDTTIYAAKMYSPNFTVDGKIFCLSLHCNGDNSYLFVNGREVTKFKAKNSELIKYHMCLGGLSKDYDRDYMKMFMTLVLTIVLFQMIKHIIFMLI